MVSVLLNWSYIFIITLLIGLSFFRGISFILKKELSFSFFSLIVCGIAVTTVYTQILSLFCRIGLFAHLPLLALCIITAVWNRPLLMHYLKEARSRLFTGGGYCTLASSC